MSFIYSFFARVMVGLASPPLERLTLQLYLLSAMPEVLNLVPSNFKILNSNSYTVLAIYYSVHCSEHASASCTRIYEKKRHRTVISFLKRLFSKSPPARRCPRTAVLNSSSWTSPWTGGIVSVCALQYSSTHAHM